MSAINLNDIMRRFEAAQLAANQANEKRYQDILASLSGMGTAARTRVAQQKTQAQGGADQDLISRGLGNTTIRQSVQRGIASDAELANQSIDEQVTGMRAGVMERRNDTGPDLSMYANLLQAAAAAGDGSKITAQVPRGTPSTPIAPGGFIGSGGTGSGGGMIGTGGTGGGGGGAGTDASIIRGTGSTAPAPAPSTGGTGTALPPKPSGGGYIGVGTVLGRLPTGGRVVMTDAMSQSRARELMAKYGGG